MQKAPKKANYSESESFAFRLGASVSQKTLGPGYVDDVLKETKLSPGTTHKHRLKTIMAAAAKRKSTENTVAFKKRRRELAESRAQRESISCVKEGPSYATGVDLVRDDQDTTTCTIPDNTPEPQRVPLQSVSMRQCVYFDLETSGVSDEEACIVQVACVSSQGEFDRYITPTRPITPVVSKITGLTVHDGILCYNHRPVQTVSLEEAIDALLEFLGTHSTPVVLVAHNAKAVDALQLSKALITSGKTEINCVAGFVDTLRLMKELYPNNTSGYSQSSLFSTVVGGKYVAHNALDDSKALKTLVETALLQNPDADLSKASMTYKSCVDHAAWMSRRKQNALTLAPLVSRKLLTPYMANKIGGSGLQLAHLQVVYRRSGSDGLEHLLGEKSSGHVRVSSRKDIISKVAQYFAA